MPQDISALVSGTYGDQSESVLYGVFNTAPNSIGGSAVCAFRLADIAAAFAGRFKEQRSTGDNWLAVEQHRVPEPRPGHKHSLDISRPKLYIGQKLNLNRS